MLGTVSANSAYMAARLRDTVQTMGLCVGPDDMNLGLRGLRTMGVRLARHQTNGIKVARWLAQAAGDFARPAPGARKRSGTCDLEARFFGRLRAVQYRAQAGAAKMRSTHFSMRSRCSASVRHGEAMKVSPFRSTARPSAPRQPGRPVDRRCDFTSALKILTISSPISNADLPRSMRASSSARCVSSRETRNADCADR